jgi:predicted HTH transcriptional regulator
MGTGHGPPLDLDAISDESATVDFKAAFDPKSKQDWCELIKDTMAMTNSGGGMLIVGIADDGSFSDYDVQTAPQRRHGGRDESNLQLPISTSRASRSFRMAFWRSSGIKVMMSGVTQT